MGGRRETSNSEKTGSEASGGEEGEGRETRAEAEVAGSVCGAGEGLERVSATTLSGPGTWTKKLVNSAR